MRKPGARPGEGDGKADEGSGGLTPPDLHGPPPGRVDQTGIEGGGIAPQITRCLVFAPILGCHRLPSETTGLLHHTPRLRLGGDRRTPDQAGQCDLSSQTQPLLVALKHQQVRGETRHVFRAKPAGAAPTRGTPNGLVKLSEPAEEEGGLDWPEAEVGIMNQGFADADQAEGAGVCEHCWQCIGRKTGSKCVHLDISATGAGGLSPGFQSVTEPPPFSASLCPAAPMGAPLLQDEAGRRPVSSG